MIDVFVGALALSTFFNILISMAPRWRIPHAPRSTSNSSKDGYHSADSGDSGYEDARTNQPPAETAQRRNSYLNVAKKSANPPEVYKIGSKEAVADWGRRFAHYHHLMGNTIDTLVTHAAGFIDPILSGELLQNFQDPDSMAISMEWPDFLQQQQSADRSGKKQRGSTFPKDSTGRPTTIGFANREERLWCDQRARDIKGDVCYRCKQDGHKAQTCTMPATRG